MTRLERAAQLPPFMLYVLSSLTCLLSGVSLSAQSTASERRRALQNGSQVPTCDAILQRRLTAALLQLRHDKPLEAMRQLLPSLTASGPRPQLRWGDRETRDLFEVLEAELRALPRERRDLFTQGLQAEAQRALAEALAHSRGLSRLRGLRAILRAFPGSEQAQAARSALVDLALERGDALEAGRYWSSLTPQARARRGPAYAALVRAARRDDPWPHVAGYANGSPGTAAARAPIAAKPKLLGRWPGRFSWDPNHARGVVARDSEGREIAVFQDPQGLLIVHDRAGRPQLERIDLNSVCKLLGDAQRTPRPALLGSRLFVVHGAVLGRLAARIGLKRPVRKQGPAAEIFAFDLQSPKSKLAWRWSPRSEPDLGKNATMLAGLCARAACIYGLVEAADDRLSRRVWAVALDEHGRLLWKRQIAKGAALTAELLLHRQEALRAGRLRAATPILAAGRLFVESGLGISACLDARDGTMLWSFRSARLARIRGREAAWDEGKLALWKQSLCLAPSDSEYFYRLRSEPGVHELLAAVPEQRGERARFVGIVAGQGASYWFRRSLLDSAFLRTLMVQGRAASGRERRYEAPPLERGDVLSCAPLLTGTSLIFASARSLAWLDLDKDLFYERIFDLHALGRAGWGPILPFRNGVLFCSDLGPLFWGTR